MFNSRVAIAPKNESTSIETQPKIVQPTKRVRKPRNKRNTIGNPGLSLEKNHPAQVIESRRKYAAREYLDKVNESGSTVSPLAISALGLSQSEDGAWNTSGKADERLYGQNLTKYNDTKLVPKTTEGLSTVGKDKERSSRLKNKGSADSNYVTFGKLIRNPNFMVDMSPEADGSQRVAFGRDEQTGKLAHPLRELDAHRWNAMKDFGNTIDGIEKSAFPTERDVKPSITNLTGAINRGLRNYSKRFNTSLFVDPKGEKTPLFRGFTTLSKNVQRMFQPYDKTRLQPPTQDELYKAKNKIREQKPELFDEKGNYVTSDIGNQVDDLIGRHIIDRNHKTQSQQHEDEYHGLTRALQNVAICPCPHCQIPNGENPLATVLDASLHREVKTSDDPVLKGVFKKHFGFYNPHALMVNDPETIYTREDGTKGGGHPHPLSTNIVRQVLHNRLKLRRLRR
jgi:hypothetical protein